MNHIRTVCVYCASSERTAAVYHQAAERLGTLLASERIAIVYGGGSTGSMGRLARAALASGGKVTGVLPQFMDELEWGNRALEARPFRPDLAPDPQLPQDTRLWALLQNASGGTWGGCVFDADAIGARLK